MVLFALQFALKHQWPLILIRGHQRILSGFTSTYSTEMMDVIDELTYLVLILSIIFD